MVTSLRLSSCLAQIIDSKFSQWFGPKAMAVAQLTSAFKDNGQVLRFDF